jgi:glycosyltransferase involved in cell wall biosynthesis
VAKRNIQKNKNMKLSILICTVVSRKTQFDNLYRSLLTQSVPQVEILYIRDNKEISVGKKRQLLLERAKGEYIVYIDDDDRVSDDYVECILKAISEFPDCIGFLINCNISGKIKHAKASRIYPDWKDDTDGYDYVRSPYHKTPIKREIAMTIGFNDIRFGEDYDYSMRLMKSDLLKKEVFINKELYFYQYVYESPEKKYGIK